MQALQFFKQLWLTLRNQPWFVTAYSLFGGAFLAQLDSMRASGHADWSLTGFEHMALAAAATTAWSLAHLYLPAPGALPVKQSG